MAKTTKRRAVVAIATVVSFSLVTSVPAWTQSLAEAARQERERKKEQSVRERHIYTNEDLTKAQILVPDDQARVLARKSDASPTVIASVPGGAALPEVPVKLPGITPRTLAAEKTVPAPDPMPTTPEAVVEASIVLAPWDMEAAKPAMAIRDSHSRQQISVTPVITPVTSQGWDLIPALTLQRPVPGLAAALASSPVAVA